MVSQTYHFRKERVVATGNEVFVVYVNDDSSLDAIRVLADNCAALADKRSVIMIKVRRPKPGFPGEFFTDEYSGWPCYSIHRYHAKAGSLAGHTITRCREKDGPTPAEGRDVHYDDDESAGTQVVWPANLPQAAMGGNAARLLGYDPNAMDYDDILTSAQALDPDSYPLS